MFWVIVLKKMGIKGFILGYAIRFVVEIIWEVIFLCSNFPDEAKFLISFKDIMEGILDMTKFSFIFVIGNKLRRILFETVSFFFFQVPNPTTNIALWLSLYQINAIGKLF